MHVQDCPWEIKNIGKKTVQLNYSLHDEYNVDEVKSAIDGYQYIVAKVPCGNINCLLGLQGDGFRAIETQIRLSKDIGSFRDVIENYKDVLRKVSFRKVNGDSDFEDMLSCVDDNMFSTDRVTLDPNFGPHIGHNRYIGWMRNEKAAGTSSFWWVNKENVSVGFMMLRICQNNIDCLLNGLFTPYHQKGLGIITPASPLLMAIREGLNVMKEETSISANNVAVVHLYNKLHFKVEGMEYVLVKHARI